MKKIQLNGIWNLRRTEDKNFIPVDVPGSVLSGLLKAGLIEDPFDRLNEYRTRELFWNDYEFVREFEVSKDILNQEKIELVCEGLDTLAEVLINGSLIGKTANMHRTWRFSLKDHLLPGKNYIRIVFHSVFRYIQEYRYAENKEVSYIPCGCMKGNQLLRKPHSMFGWDWGPQLPDAGIFRDIYLEAYSGVRIKEVQIHQEHQNGVKVHVQATLEGNLKAEQEINVKITECGTGVITGQQRMKSAACEAGKFSLNLEIQKPKLWWPNGYGEQNLYEVEVELRDGTGNVLDDRKKIIGLRSLKVSQEPDKWGKEFAFQVNGVKIFTKGGNYIPEDCIYSRITAETQEYLLESCRRAHFNCIRVWGGGYYPSDAFYDLCDRKGLIVWQDLMYACNVYDVTNEFAENCRMEILDNVKRLRHHACLGLWCGNNEIESAWHHWPDFQKETMYLRADYIKLFEAVLPKAVREADPDTFYWPSSPSSGGCFANPDDENQGDTHYWDVWHGQKPFSDYRKYFFRFCSEFGFQSFPCMKTVKTFTRESDRNIFSRVMESHQKNNSANGKMLYYLSENFKYPDNFRHLLYVSQILQAMAIKSGVDHWRRNRGRCMGTLYWQVNDNWPAPSWSSIDYFGRWKALHYLACKFYAPLAVSMVRAEEKVTVYFENESMRNRTYTVKLYVKDMDCKSLKTREESGKVDSLSSKAVLEISTDDLAENADRVFLEAEVILDGGERLTDVETLLPYKYLELKKPSLTATVEERTEDFIIQIQGKSFAPFVELDFEDADVIFEDNYFHITEENPVSVHVRKRDILKGSFKDAKDLQNRLTVCSVADTYTG